MNQYFIRLKCQRKVQIRWQFSCEMANEVLLQCWWRPCVSVSRGRSGVSLSWPCVLRVALESQGGISKPGVKDMGDLDLDQDVPSVEWVLGVQWCISSETFKFNIAHQKGDPLRGWFHLWSFRNLRVWWCCPLRSPARPLSEWAWLGWHQLLLSERAGWKNSARWRTLNLLETHECWGNYALQVHLFTDIGEFAYCCTVRALRCTELSPRENLGQLHWSQFPSFV